MADARAIGDGQRALLLVASFVIVIAGMKAAQPILAPVLLAAFVALIITPVEHWLMRKRLPRWAAILLVVLAVVGVLGGLSTVVGTSVATFRENLPDYEQSLRQQIGALIDSAGDLAHKAGIDLAESDLKKGLDPALAFTWVHTAAVASGNLVSNALFVMATTAFMLGEGTILPQKLRLARGAPEHALESEHRFTASLTGYVQVKAVTSGATGVLVTIACALVEVDFPFLWGILAFGLNFVPNIGSILAAIPAIALAFVIGGAHDALLLTGAYAVINVTIGSVLEPKLMGSALGLSTLVVFLSLVFWGWVLGPVGMLLSVPLTMAVKVAAEQSDDLRWVGILFGAGDADGGAESAATTAEA